MLRELMSIFRSNDAIAEMGESFGEMLELARELTLSAGTFYFAEETSPDERTFISKRDVQLNKLQRRIRKQVIAHLTVGDSEGDAPYCLLLMSIVKDVERIGDYCKNLVEIYDEGGGPIPDDENAHELQEIRVAVEEVFAATGDVFRDSDSEMALDLIRRGRELNRRCDILVSRVARSSYDAPTTTTMVLGARYYKRIGSHLMNVLSGVVMPLHKLDYYDEWALPEELEPGDADD